MNPLERLLRPVAAMINRQVTGKTPARQLCAELAGRVIAVRLRDTTLAMFFLIETDGVELALDSERDPDVQITGSLFSLAGLAAGGGEDGFRDGSVDLSGDVYTAQAFQRLLALGKPDLEEELAQVIGDVAARGVGDGVRGFVDWAKGAGTTLRQNVTEYLQEERQALPSRYEVDRFRRRVNELRDDVDRLAARIQRLDREKL